VRGVDRYIQEEAIWVAMDLLYPTYFRSEWPRLVTSSVALPQWVRGRKGQRSEPHSAAATLPAANGRVGGYGPYD
jgi:hypothetical protein